MMTPLEALQQFCPDEFVVLQERRAAVLSSASSSVRTAAVKPEPQRLSSGDETETSTAAPSEQSAEESSMHDFSDNEEDDEDDKAPNNFICPLTLQVMRDPVLSRYGQNYERNAILEWLTSSNGHGSCPLTRRPLELRGLVSNHNLRRQIRQWQWAQQQQQQPHKNNTNRMNNTMPSLDDDDDEPKNAASRCGVYGSAYYLVDWNDEAEHTEEDPPLILEYRRGDAATPRSPPAAHQRPQRRRHRRGLLGRLRRVVGASSRA